MNKTLEEIAEQLRDSSKKVNLIYAFNGSGKTQLSKKFKELIEENKDSIIDNYLYFNDLTEDLFYWNNNQDNKLKIHPSVFITWLIEEQGYENNIIDNFEKYTHRKVTAKFNKISSNRTLQEQEYYEIIFTLLNSSEYKIIKPSRGEEKKLIWSIFYTLVNAISDDIKELEKESEFFNVKYIFIDDPVSSLDDNNLINIALDLSKLIKSTNNINFIITTHNSLFYNILCNEFKNDKKYGKYILQNKEEEKYDITESNDHPFSYHIFLKNKIEEAVKNNELQKYHFNLMRNILEKTATYLEYDGWKDLLTAISIKNKKIFSHKMMDINSHSTHSYEETSILEEVDKKNLEELLYALNEFCNFKKVK